MGNISPDFNGILRRHPTEVKVAVETGTYEGQQLPRLARFFEKVHTVELSEKYYDMAREKYGHLPVEFHLADSAIKVRELCESISEDALWYLDAHTTSEADDAAESFPLWRELEAISDRDNEDVVIVDDLGIWGKTRDDLKHSGWAKVSVDKIKACLGFYRVKQDYEQPDAWVFHLGRW